MEIITITKENLEQEHICCAISNNNDCQVASKKAWMARELDNGLVFKKANVRGKCFIEYIPAENAWAPVSAEGYMYINCLWVSGQFKGHGYSNLLLEECIKDSKAKGKKGLVVLSSKKKMGFLADPKFLAYKGFKVADTADPYFVLMYLPFEENSVVPAFKECAKKPHIDSKEMTLYYTAQCPFTAKYVPIIENMAHEGGLDFKAVKIQSADEAQNAPTPFTTYSLFCDGEFMLNEILSEKKFEKLFLTGKSV